MHGKVRKLVNSIMIDYYKILVGTENAACTNIAQELICVTNEAGKLYTLRQMFLDGKLPPPVLVFISSREKSANTNLELIRYLNNLPTTGYKLLNLALC